jgi:hypothetical protein
MEKSTSIAKFETFFGMADMVVSLVEIDSDGRKHLEVGSYPKAGGETAVWTFSDTAEGRRMAYHKCMTLVGYNATCESAGLELVTVDGRGRVWQAAGHWAADTGTPAFDAVHRLAAGKHGRKIHRDGGAMYKAAVARMFGGR